MADVTSTAASKFLDGETLTFGSDDDHDLVFDATAGELQVRDSSGNALLRFDTNVALDDDEFFVFGTDDDHDIGFDSAAGEIQVRDSAGNSLVGISGSTVDMTGSGDLQIGTGQSVLDGGSNNRIRVLSNGTQIHDDAGTLAFNANSGSAFSHRATSAEPMVIKDDQGSFDAVTYSTAASAPGTLDVANARIEGRTAALFYAGL